MSKDVTTEELARMVASGFAEGATKQNVAELRLEMQDEFSDVKATLARIENRLTHVDDSLIADHAMRIKNLEEVVRLSRR